MGGPASTALLIALGGALGTLLRWGTGLAIARESWPDFPWGTFTVNVVGSFALGLVAEALGERRMLGTEVRLFLGTGVLGGFTTYSSFNLETLRMLERGDHGKAALYVAATVVVCLLAGAGGLALGRALRGS
jgi:CrcB protein